MYRKLKKKKPPKMVDSASCQEPEPISGGNAPQLTQESLARVKKPPWSLERASGFAARGGLGIALAVVTTAVIPLLTATAEFISTQRTSWVEESSEVKSYFAAAVGQTAGEEKHVRHIRYLRRLKPSPSVGRWLGELWGRQPTMPETLGAWAAEEYERVFELQGLRLATAAKKYNELLVKLALAENLYLMDVRADRKAHAGWVDENKSRDDIVEVEGLDPGEGTHGLLTTKGRFIRQAEDRLERLAIAWGETRDQLLLDGRLQRLTIEPPGDEGSWWNFWDKSSGESETSTAKAASEDSIWSGVWEGYTKWTTVNYPYRLFRNSIDYAVARCIFGPDLNVQQRFLPDSPQEPQYCLFAAKLYRRSLQGHKPHWTKAKKLLKIVCGDWSYIGCYELSTMYRLKELDAEGNKSTDENKKRWRMLRAFTEAKRGCEKGAMPDACNAMGWRILKGDNLLEWTDGKFSLNDGGKSYSELFETALTESKKLFRLNCIAGNWNACDSLATWYDRLLRPKPRKDFLNKLAIVGGKKSEQNTEKLERDKLTLDQAKALATHYASIACENGEIRACINLDNMEFKLATSDHSTFQLVNRSSDGLPSSSEPSSGEPVGTLEVTP